jgi:hypothetical protein
MHDIIEMYGEVEAYHVKMHIGHNILLIRKDKCHVDNKNENREELNE